MSIRKSASKVAVCLVSLALLLGLSGCATLQPFIIFSGVPASIILGNSATLTAQGEIAPGVPNVPTSVWWTFTFSSTCGGTFSTTVTPNNGPANPLIVGPSNVNNLSGVNSVTYNSTGATLGPCTLSVTLKDASVSNGQSATASTQTVIVSISGKMYWTDLVTQKIQRANLDGSNAEDLITSANGIGVPVGIALDLSTGKIYWTTLDNISPTSAKIQRADLDGSNIEDLVTTASAGIMGPQGIALDLINGKIYWADFVTHKIQRSNLDGSNVEDLVTNASAGLDYPGGAGLALDLGNDKMYWADAITSKIQRANLDGSNVEDLVTSGLYEPLAVVLDLPLGKMYWTDRKSHKIQRSNIDGSNVEDLVTNSFPPYHVGGCTSSIPHTIEPIDAPIGMALGIVDHKMYWTDCGIKKIQRANLDGSDIEDLLTNASAGLIFPGMIAIAH